jgi:hypothetical protein
MCDQFQIFLTNLQWALGGGLITLFVLVLGYCFTPDDEFDE